MPQFMVRHESVANLLAAVDLARDALLAAGDQEIPYEARGGNPGEYVLLAGDTKLMEDYRRSTVPRIELSFADDGGWMVRGFRTSDRDAELDIARPLSGQLVGVIGDVPAAVRSVRDRIWGESESTSLSGSGAWTWTHQQIALVDRLIGKYIEDLGAVLAEKDAVENLLAAALQDRNDALARVEYLEAEFKRLHATARVADPRLRARIARGSAKAAKGVLAVAAAAAPYAGPASDVASTVIEQRANVEVAQIEAARPDSATKLVLRFNDTASVVEAECGPIDD